MFLFHTASDILMGQYFISWTKMQGRCAMYMRGD